MFTIRRPTATPHPHSQAFPSGARSYFIFSCSLCPECQAIACTSLQQIPPFATLPRRLKIRHHHGRSLTPRLRVIVYAQVYTVLFLFLCVLTYTTPLIRVHETMQSASQKIARVYRVCSPNSRERTSDRVYSFRTTVFCVRVSGKQPRPFSDQSRACPPRRKQENTHQRFGWKTCRGWCRPRNWRWYGSWSAGRRRPPASSPSSLLSMTS